MEIVTTKTKTRVIKITQSVTLVKNLFRASFSSIAFVRGFFGDEHFTRGKMGPTKYRKLLNGTNEEVKLYTDWLEKGVFDALQKKYLEVVLLEIYDGSDSTKLLECFSFGVSYTDEGASFSLGGGTGKGETSKPIDVEAKEEIKTSTSAVIRTLIELCAKLQPLPDNRIISMKLLYTPNTPKDYEPPLFGKAPSENVSWFQQKPSRVVVEPSVVTPFHHVSLSIRSANIIDQGMYTLANAIKEREEAEKKRNEEEARISAERAAVKKREQAEKAHEAEEARKAAERAANAEKKRRARIAAEKEEKIRQARIAETEPLANAEKKRKEEMEQQRRAADKRLTKKKLMNPRKKTTPTSKKKATTKPTVGKISKAKKSASPGPPRRTTRNKKPTYTSKDLSDVGSESSTDGSRSVYTMNTQDRKTSVVNDNVHQE